MTDFNPLDRIRRYALTVLGCAGFAALIYFAGHAVGTRDEQGKQALRQSKARAELIEHARRDERRATGAVNALDAAVTQKADAVRTVTKTLIERVPTYVPYSNDVADRVTVGFARLHDAAAAGDADALSAASGPTDAEASPFTKTDLAFAIAWNYGLKHECDVQLNGLIDYETGRQKFEADQDKMVGVK